MAAQYVYIMKYIILNLIWRIPPVTSNFIISNASYFILLHLQPKIFLQLRWRASKTFRSLVAI
jgi:hypothetical protein